MCLNTKRRFLPGFHFHNHNTYVSETMKPSMKLLRKITNLCTIVVISKFLHIAITFDHISIIFPICGLIGHHL